MLIDRENRSEFQVALGPLLEAAITLDNAAKGNVQLYYPSINALKIVAHKGFNLEFLQLFDVVHLDEPCACGRALRDKCRVTITDITKEKSYSPFVSISLANGYRAVQSTPILADDNSVCGMLSTHFAEAHRLSNIAKTALDNVACEMASVIQTHFPACTVAGSVKSIAA